jgi:ubiquinone/menaquinone biosynthesis C-methylase UbiE
MSQTMENAQLALWNGSGGQSWVDAQEILDKIFRPLEELLVKSTVEGRGRRVLDVGCGTGTTTLAVARMLETEGRCVGIDISGPMLAAARKRATREGTSASFVHGDAQVYAFRPASFDTLISRFGVMFFDDPVAAFVSLRRAAKPGAQLLFAAWRSTAENPFIRLLRMRPLRFCHPYPHGCLERRGSSPSLTRT